MNEEEIKQDPYAVFRNIMFQYQCFFLNDFFDSHHIKKNDIEKNSNFGGRTLASLLNGKDMHFNCHLRLLAAMEEYCEDNDEYLDFVLEFLKRSIVEIRLIRGEEPKGWMLITWEKMQLEKNKYLLMNS